LVTAHRHALYFASMSERPLTKCNSSAILFCYGLRCGNVWTGG